MFPGKQKKKLRRKDPTAAQKVRLVTEVGSRCPWCAEADPQGVWNFHHIDKKSWNTVLKNLIAMCPTHHTKITRGDISKAEVKKKKRDLAERKIGAELSVRPVMDCEAVPMKPSPRMRMLEGLI